MGSRSFVCIGLSGDNLNKKHKEDFRLGFKFIGELLEKQKHHSGRPEGQWEERTIGQRFMKHRAKVVAQK